MPSRTRSSAWMRRSDSSPTSASSARCSATSASTPDTLIRGSNTSVGEGTIGLSSRSVIAGSGGPDELPGDPHARIMDLIARDRCVVLDGATGTELIEVAGDRPEREEHLWGLSAILDMPDDVRSVHRRYAEAGCDIVSTDTWGLPTALRDGGPRIWGSRRPVHWMDVARQGVRLAREAIAEA